MIRYALHLLLIAGALALASCQTYESRSTPQHAAEDVLAEWSIAYEAGDTPALMRLYHEIAISDDRRLGRMDREELAGYFDAHFAATRARDIEFLGAASVLEAGRTKVVSPYRVTLTSVDGLTTTHTGLIELDVAQVDGGPPRIIRGVADERRLNDAPLAAPRDVVLGFHDAEERGWFPHLTDADRRSLAWFTATKAVDAGMSAFCIAKGLASEANPLLVAIGLDNPAGILLTSGLGIYGAHKLADHQRKNRQDPTRGVKIATGFHVGLILWNTAVCFG